MHHWLFKQNTGLGKYVPDVIKNQPWNLMPMKSPRIHYLADHGNILQKFWYGTPRGAKAFLGSTVGRTAGAAIDSAEGMFRREQAIDLYVSRKYVWQ